VESKRDQLGQHGLALPRRVLRRLDEVSIFVQPQVSLEHQHLAKRYVVRGIESGGAVKDLGRYVTFSGPAGEPLPYVHPIDAIGVNGLHAVVVAPVLVRIEMLRVGRTWQLLITRHQPAAIENGRRPTLENVVLFRGMNGFLDAGLSGETGDSVSSAMPQFWSRAGEPLEIPPIFETAVRAAARGASCLGCAHAHFLSASAGMAETGKTV